MAKLNKLEDKADGDTLCSQHAAMANVAGAQEELLKTPPKKEGKHTEGKTPSTESTKKLANDVATPRRSTRKCHKPLLDYQEIICNSARKSLLSIPEQLNKFVVSETAEETSQQKWTIAEVGRDRHKRSRRSRRNSKVRKSQSDNEENEDNVKLEVDLSPIKEEKEKQQVNENNEMHIVEPLNALPPVQEVTVSNDEHKFHMLNDTQQKVLEEKREADDIIDLTTPLKHVSNEGSMIGFGSHLKPSDAEMEDLGLITLHDETENSIEINTNLETKDDAKIILKSDNSQINDTTFEISDDEDGDKENQQPISIDLASLPTVTGNDHMDANDSIPMNDMDSPIPLDAYASEMHLDTNASNSIKSTVKSNTVLQEITEFEVACNYFQTTGILTTMESKGIVLRGIRKRSLSVCIGESRDKMRGQILKESDSKPKTKKSVKFYSPANEMTIIDDLDLQIAQSANCKSKSFIKMPKDSVQAGEAVSRRPKRSVSMDDICNRSRIPRPMNNTPTKKKTPLKELPASKEKIVRSKLPNFAAIHERQFKKMENLIEYVHRKQERSKNLLNSNSKTSGSAFKVCNQGEGVSSGKINELKKQPEKLTTERPRSQKMLQMTSSTPKKLIATIKPLTCTKSPLKSHSSSSIPTVLQIPYKPPSKPFKVGNNNSEVDNKIKKNTSKNKDMEDKAAERLQRHMDLFKGRNHSTTKSKIKDQREKESYIRGVRSNRRFELLMNHRRNMEK